MIAKSQIRMLLQRKDRFMNRCYGAEEELRARRIWARYVPVVLRAGLGCVQPAELRVVERQYKVIAEPLHMASQTYDERHHPVPRISINGDAIDTQHEPDAMTRCWNLGVEKNSRMARRYAMPALPAE